ncbi:MAG: SRPBCC domain-containing protein [Chitinophagaceae bacterium]|nr:SRPBCC domain-containing protein [Chitinophagaceae bacterium]
MSTTAINWSSFKLRVNIKKTIEELYSNWTTPQALESWFLREAVFVDADGKERSRSASVQKGDTYTWRWHGYPDDVKETGIVLEANGSDLFRFSFSLGCPVTIQIYPEAGETIVELMESDLPTDDKTTSGHFVGDSRGWIFYLANLKSIVEGGIDLRNKNVNIRDVITS